MHPYRVAAERVPQWLPLLDFLAVYMPDATWTIRC